MTPAPQPDPQPEPGPEPAPQPAPQPAPETHAAGVPTTVRELILTGPPLGLALPDVCARCGEHAAKRLYWEKVVRDQSSDDGNSHHIAGCRAPFCARCLEQHEREIKRMPALMQLLQTFRSQSVIPAVLLGAFGAFLTWKLRPDFLHPDALEMAAFAGVALVFGLLSLLCWKTAWSETRHHCVPPLTTVTGSFHFSGDLSEMFEGERYRYAIVNDAFYEALLAANRDKLWKPTGERARRASWKRKALYVALGITAAILLLWDWIQPWVRVEW